MKRIHSLVGKRKAPAKSGEFVIGNTQPSRSNGTIRKFHFNPKLFTAISAFIAVFGVYTIFFSQAATPTQANLWMDTNGGSCTRQATPGAYNDAQACGSLNAALTAAARGDTVLIKGGTYGPQRVTATPGGSSGTVSIQEANGETVIIGNGSSHDCQGRSVSNYPLCIEDGSFFELVGVQLGANEQYGVEIANTEPGSLGSQFVALKDVVGKTFRIVGRVSDISIIGGDFGDSNENSKPQIKKYNPTDANTSRPNNILIEGVQLHDSICSDGQNCSTVDHTECLQLIHSQNVTIRANKFSHCEGTGGIGVTDGPHSTLTIENNSIADQGSSYGCQITTNVTNLTLQYNSFGDKCFFSDTGGTGPYTIKGNYGYFHTSLCKGGVQYSYNLLKGGSCGGTGDQNVSTLNWVNEAGGDLRLAAGANAINQAGSSCPATDIAGTSRPQGAACDAGAYEYASGGGGTDTTPPDTSITTSTPANGASTSSTTASISFTGTDNIGVTSFECSLDSTTAYATCTSAKSYTGLTTGSHTIRVRAKDAAGNTDQTPALVTFTVTSGSSSPTNGLLGSDLNFFPIGVWWQSPALNYGGKTVAKAYADIGINTMLFPPDRVLDSGDAAAMSAAGVYSVGNTQASVLGTSNAANTKAWTQADEPDNAQWNSNTQTYDPCISPSVIVNKYNTLKATDPSRPVWMNFGQGVANTNWIGRGTCTGETGMYAQYAAGADILSFDVYPVNDGYPLTYVADGVGNLRNWTGDTKPVWAYVETTSIEGATKPTTTQVKMEVWSALVHGARGISYFAHTISPNFDERGLLNDTAMATAVGGINAQIKSLAPVLNSATVANGATVSSSARIDKMVKQYNNETYLFAVGMTSSSTTGNFHVNGLTNGTVTVIGENRTLTMTNGNFSDSFGGYGVHLYKITQTGTPTCSTKQGDANNDQAVNISDIAAILSTYGQTNTTNCADVNKDGSVNISDIALVLSKYGT